MIWSLLLGVSAAWAAGSPTYLPIPEEEVLPNGLRVVWFVNDRLPVVDLGLMVRSGSVDDPAGKSGTAELLGMLLDRGAGGQGPQALAGQLEKLGASRTTSADLDSFSLGVHGLAQDADALLSWMSQVITKWQVPESEFKLAQGRLIDLWKQVQDHSPTLLALAMDRLLFSGTRYGRGAFGSSAEAAQLTLEDCRTFFRTHFTPKNSVLIVVGRVKRAEFRARVLASLGQPTVWSGEKPKREISMWENPHLKLGVGEVLLIEKSGLTQAQVQIGEVGPLISAPDHDALAVGNALLGEYFNSRLNSVIRDQLGLTYGIQSNFGFQKESGRFVVTAATRNEAAGPMIQRTREILSNVAQGKIEAEEVETSKKYLLGSFPLTVATLSAVASRWLGMDLYDLPKDYLAGFPGRIRAVTLPQVQNALRKNLHPEKQRVVIVGDPATVVPSLKKAGITRIKRVPAQRLLSNAPSRSVPRNERRNQSPAKAS